MLKDGSLGTPEGSDEVLYATLDESKRVLERSARHPVGVGYIEVTKPAEAVDTTTRRRRKLLYNVLLMLVHDEDEFELTGHLSSQLTSAMKREIETPFL